MQRFGTDHSDERRTEGVMNPTEHSIGAQDRPWYCAFQAQVLGPFSWAQMRDRATSGQLTPADLICQEGQNQWVSAASVVGLFGPTAATPHVTEGVAHSISDTPDALVPALLSAPPRIPGYEILHEVGRGGMGVVYKARQLSLSRIVALKMILGADQANPTQRARFTSEARALARVQHTGIVQIYEVGDHLGQPYLALQFVEGGSLKDHLRGTPLEANEAAVLIERLARAIHVAHEAGIVHRDLKPGNILIDRQGMPHITDFGLAKDLERETQQTLSGAVMGTPAYMAPEQAMGNSRGISPRTDLYALGAILYELLTGTPPFSGPAHVIVYNVIERLPDAPRKINGRVPAELDKICMQCLAKKPAQRFATALELADKLRHFVDSQITLVPPPPLAPRAPLAAAAVFPRPRSRLRLVAVALLLGALGVLAWRAEHARLVAEQGRDDLAQERQRLEELLGREQESTRRLQHREALARYSQVLHETQLDWTVGKSERARQRLQFAPSECRRWEWNHLDATTALGPIQSFDGHARGALAVAFSPDFSLLASGGADDVLRLWDTTTGKERHAWTGHTKPITAVVFAPDGKTVLTASNDKTVKVWDFPSGTVRYTFTLHTHEVLALALSPDGKRVLSSDYHGNVLLWDSASGAVVNTLESKTNESAAAVAWSSDGKRLAWATGDRGIKVWDVTNSKLLYHLTAHTGSVRALAFNSDGSRLASGGADSAAKIWDMKNGAEKASMTGHTNTINGIAFSPDGRQLLTSSSDGTLRQWDVESGKEYVFARRELTITLHRLALRADGKRFAVAMGDRAVKVWRAGLVQPRGTLSAHGEAVNAVAHSSDRQLIVTGSSDRTVKVWHATNGVVQFTFSGHEEIVSGVACSPEGQWVASASVDRTVRLWSLTAGETQSPRILRGHQGSVLCVTYNHDGKQLFTSGEDAVIKLWDATAGQWRQDFKGHMGAVYALACSPDGQRLASAGHDSTVRVWETATGKELLTLQGHVDPVRCVAYSPDGKTIASMDEEGMTRVWDATTGKERLVLRMFGANLGNLGLAFSPDGQRLVTAGPGEVRLWDLEDGDLVVTLKFDIAPLRALTFSRDGRTLLLAAGKAAVVLHGN